MIDRSFVLELAGVPYANGSASASLRTFKTQKHSVTISNNQYTLYDTAGLTDSDASSKALKPLEVLRSLYQFICALDGGVNLLIYVVDDRPSLNNFKLFHDYICQGDSPIIVVTTDPNHPLSLPDGAKFTHVFLPRDSVAEINKAQLQKAITKRLKKHPNVIPPRDRFEQTVMDSWKLLEQAAGWSFVECRDALKTTFVQEASLSSDNANARCQAIVDHVKQHYCCNVIVFGDTGVGKTSVIKMLTEECDIDPNKASSAGGSTSESKGFKVDIGEYHYVFYDTVGLDDATLTTKSPEEAIKALYQLIRTVGGGVGLLVYVHRGKIKPSQVNNYRLFSHVLCQKNVPTVLVVTGLEAEESRDKWWGRNKHLFDAQNIDTKHYACITSTQGKFNHKFQEFTFQEEYDQSRKQLKQLFLSAPLVNPWKAESPSLWKAIIFEVYNIFAKQFKGRTLVVSKLLYKNLMSIMGMEENEARNLANEITRVLPKR